MNNYLVEEIIEAIEEEYGLEVERIAKVEPFPLKSGFKLYIVFIDYRLLIADVEIVEDWRGPAFLIEGTYY